MSEDRASCGEAVKIAQDSDKHCSPAGAGLLVPDSACCPICHETMRVADESFLATCYHRFCFHCILQWTDSQAAYPPSRDAEPRFTCPLCKRPYDCILHDVMDSGCFRRYFLPGADASSDPGATCNLSVAHRRRRAAYFSSPQPPVTTVQRRLSEGRARAEAELWLRRELQALLMQENCELVLLHLLAHLNNESSSGTNEAKRRKRGQGRIPFGGRGATGGGEAAAAVVKGQSSPKSQDGVWLKAVAASAARFVFEHADRLAYEFAQFCDSGMTVVAYDASRNPQVQTTDDDGAVD